MTDTAKVLGQSNPSATTLTDIYTVPGATSVVISSITICNQSASPGSFRLAIAVAGAADAPKQYLYYDLPTPANDSFGLTLGITLAATDVIRVYASNANMSFNVFGIEVT